ncbi:glutamate racemase [Variovorax sp. ZT4R33]|uniref:glutamate racemase n=1 Tax=Variovorax sp. ZT4R33 TaxID=3443743 RepID=UPI003F48E5DF
MSGSAAVAPGDRAIGVFDSGIGGLSVLNALRREMPGEDFVYFADTAHAPYGERDDAHVVDRTRTVARELLAHHRIKALVVACNTATAAAIHVLRSELPSLPLVGVEPALRPAAALSRTRRIAVLATRGTVQSSKFATLRESIDASVDVRVVACDGLARAIEDDDAPLLAELGARYVHAAGDFGTAPGQIDTLVLGCTHYPFAATVLRASTGDAVHFLETGAPVARQTRRLLEAGAGLAVRTAGRLQFEASGPLAPLERAAARWLLVPAMSAVPGASA